MQLKRKKQPAVRYKRMYLSPAVREAVKRRDGYKCKYCKVKQAKGVKLEVDHVIPVAKGGTNDFSNLQTLCWECNLKKSDKLIRIGPGLTINKVQLYLILFFLLVFFMSFILTR